MTIASDILTVSRYSAQVIGVDGRAGASVVASTFPISASVQRPSAYKLQKLMEGGRTQDAWYVDTYTAIQSANELAGTPADTVVIDGNTYEVFEVAHVRAVIVHYEALVLRVEEGRQP